MSAGGAVAGIGHAGRALSILLGVSVIALALSSYGTAAPPADVLDWMWRTLGAAYIGLLLLLAGAAVFCWVSMMGGNRRRELWLQAGLQAAGAIATVSLTFTLLGISLGIGSLAEAELTPDTVQGVIADLTDKFSLAFFTTVLGLPVSVALRALLLITHAARAPRMDPPGIEGETS